MNLPDKIVALRKLQDEAYKRLMEPRMTTFPSVEIKDLVTQDEFSGNDTKHANLPCLMCMFKGELDRWKQANRATKLVCLADIIKIPLCLAHAEEYVGDKR